MPIRELRDPRIANAATLGDCLPFTLAGVEQFKDFGIKLFGHSDNIANVCWKRKQPITTRLDDYSAMSVKQQKPINVVLAENIAAAMQRKQITSQEQLAKVSGVSQRTISNYLNPDKRAQGKSGRAPSAKLSEVEQIARALNVETWDLLRQLSPRERELHERIEAAYRALRGDEETSEHN